MNHRFTETEDLGKKHIWGECPEFRFSHMTFEMPVECGCGSKDLAGGQDLGISIEPWGVLRAMGPHGSPGAGVGGWSPGGQSPGLL